MTTHHRTLERALERALLRDANRTELNRTELTRPGTEFRAWSPSTTSLGYVTRTTSDGVVDQ